MKPNLVPTTRPSKDSSRDSNPAEPWWVGTGRGHEKASFSPRVSVVL
jgi:hypothetical protein